jgi:RNA polymerase sigma factor (sigma-70 family)|tara:strand:- start:366 stop:995 length:630 start_codon:yes stop_codon:yes gene_type:complete
MREADGKKKWLEKVFSYHSLWIDMATALGGGIYSEDIVSESYIKLDKYKCEKKIIANGKVSKGYMFFVIRSIFIKYIKQSNKIRRVDISKLYNLSGKSWFIDPASYSRTQRELKQNVERVHYNSENVEKEYAYGRICKKIDKEIKTWNWYDKKIFELYRDTPLTIRALAEETNISTTNIFHTLKKGKKIIKEKFQDDYEDYTNGDYDLI